MPGVVFDGAQGEVIGDLRCRHTVLHILLIGEYQHSCLPQVLRGVVRDRTEYSENPRTGQRTSTSMTSWLDKDVLPHEPTSCRAPL